MNRGDQASRHSHTNFFTAIIEAFYVAHGKSMLFTMDHNGPGQGQGKDHDYHNFMTLVLINVQLAS